MKKANQYLDKYTDIADLLIEPSVLISIAKIAVEICYLETRLKQEGISRQLRESLIQELNDLICSNN